ncbi:hypothetical protein QJQ45_016211, partial [Haematococcus lacustris]
PAPPPASLALPLAAAAQPCPTPSQTCPTPASPAPPHPSLYLTAPGMCYSQLKALNYTELLGTTLTADELMPGLAYFVADATCACVLCLGPLAGPCQMNPLLERRQLLPAPVTTIVAASTEAAQADAAPASGAGSAHDAAVTPTAKQNPKRVRPPRTAKGQQEDTRGAELGAGQASYSPPVLEASVRPSPPAPAAPSPVAVQSQTSLRITFFGLDLWSLCTWESDIQARVEARPSSSNLTLQYLTAPGMCYSQLKALNYTELLGTTLTADELMPGLAYFVADVSYLVTMQMPASGDLALASSGRLPLVTQPVAQDAYLDMASIPGRLQTATLLDQAAGGSLAALSTLFVQQHASTEAVSVMDVVALLMPI